VDYPTGYLDESRNHIKLRICLERKNKNRKILFLAGIGTWVALYSNIMKIMKMIRKVIIPFIMLSVLSLNSCQKENPGPDEVLISGSKYTPATLTVTAGTTVTWTNNDNYTHSVTSDTGLFESGDMGNGDAFTFTFSTTGTYDYHCRFHGSMTGTVIVE
jgi:plastocyanin